MASPVAVDAKNTFAYALFMGADKKVKYNSPGEVEMTADGQVKWAVRVAVEYLPEPGRPPVSDMLKVSVNGSDPGAGLTPGTPIEFEGLRAGVMAPEMRDFKGDGNKKLTGGSFFYTARSIRRSGAPANGGRPEPVAAGKPGG